MDNTLRFFPPDLSKMDQKKIIKHFSLIEFLSDGNCCLALNSIKFFDPKNYCKLNFPCNLYKDNTSDKGDFSRSTQTQM